ncbi:coproporphyrinogen III oxidase family protein [Slackia exigua]|uniref:coproporphyrinogen III oxidase family protein n=1 Tax=Slackia exigua TaxID=84109 RepID=UPI00254B6C79|nr:coproporphyrinogen III oxidase family protein [Slackia exigua]MDK7723491.1 coproporphyrinogen III oxidase family protein [Slackia exigua]MDK7724846.1 coproporphyrinogen III oxidase family protein [Slackia exigua]
MLSERLLSKAVRHYTSGNLRIDRTEETRIPGPQAGMPYMLYMHIPFCERLCPYCSFNRFPFNEGRAKAYYENLRREMMMVKELGYDFDSLYIGGGTPTILLDELCKTIDAAKREFSIKDVSCETNPNHLTEPYLSELEGRVNRLSVGVQSFDDGLLKQMDRYDKYGDAASIMEAVKIAAPYFDSMNVDMIFNFPAQTEDILRRDLEAVIETGCNQTTFYPLMASPAVERSLAATVGKVDYGREQRFYRIISETLADGPDALFTHSSAWTFNRTADAPTMIDEYIVDYEQYPAIGSGGFTYLGDSQYINTFSVREYNQAIDAGRMSIMGKTTFSKANRMRYRFLMQLFGLRLDKTQFERDFGCSVQRGLPVEYAFMKAVGGIDKDDDEQLTLTPKGRYLMVVMMRQFFIGVNNLRDQARSILPPEERELLFGNGCAMKE